MLSERRSQFAVRLEATVLETDGGSERMKRVGGRVRTKEDCAESTG